MAQAPHPRMHGLTHVTGGSDPILGLLPGPIPTFYDAIFAIAATSDLRGYWRLGDGSLGPYADSKPAGVWANTPMERVAVTVAMADLDRGALSEAQDDGAVRFNDPLQGLPIRSDYLRAPDIWVGGAGNPFENDLSAMTVMGWVNPSASGSMFDGGVFSMMAQTSSGQDGYVLGVSWPTRSVFFQTQATRLTGPILAAEEWVFACAVHDAISNRIYLNGALVATGAPVDPSPSTNLEPMIGLWNHSAGTGPGPGVLYGAVDEVAVFATALTHEQIATLWGAGTEGGTTGGGPGDVLTVGEDGNPTWDEPTVEVTGGGINPTPPDETPVDSSEPAASGPTTSTGWHLNGHFETVVLHDPNPGRFDVPTMKWTRVPFTSITIYRTWEPTIDAVILKTARLKDDRELMQAASDGILHINSDMAWPSAPPMNIYIDDSLVSHPEHHLVEGWFSIEYPVLDALYLPENDVELLTLGPTPAAPRPGISVIGQDGYQRGSRFMNVSTGSVLRFHAGSAARAIVNWWLAATADDSTGAGDGPGTGSLDNPFPIWGDWPARPIHMTPPYPQLNPTDSRAYYQDYQGMAGNGFGPYRGVTAGTNLSAGANLCMQAWQDTPWLLRFSTARFPAYRGFDADYNGFPHLAITYHYDPDTINHTTGRLLLPAT